MDHVQWTEHPSLRRPVLVAAFEGWNDAGEAATDALRTLTDAVGARPFATIDPESFTDFAVSRPVVRLGVDGQRRIEWPSTELRCGPLPGSDRDVIILTGSEPRLRWRTFCGEITDLAAELGVTEIVTLGALLADVVHTAPVRVIGGASDPGTTARLGLRTSRYEGPTGIVGVLGTEARDAGFPVVSLWAPVPTYVPANSSPKAALALLRALTSYLGVQIDADDLEEAALEYEERVDELVDADHELSDYVRQLVLSASDEDEVDVEEADPAELVAEVERFLRDQKGPGPGPT
jgi:proteasome assembly chaperone (PAC2) family protein